MIGFIKDNFIYIKCPKNGCMTYSTLLKKHGWQEINFFENDLDYSKFVLWGHLTEPNVRHTNGLVQYLKLNPDINIDDQTVAKMLISGVFDEHTYSLNMMLGALFSLPIHWIPLDVSIIDYRNVDNKVYNGDDLTNEFFKENNIDITISIKDRLNVSNSYDAMLKDQVREYKQVFDENYQKILKNFLEPDILLYTRTLKKYRIRYGSTE